MRAFWWFRENSIAGMGRPGFNSMPWLDLPFEEAALVGWVGQYAGGRVHLDFFRHHLRHYVPKIFAFHKLSPYEGAKVIEIFHSPQGIDQVLNRLNDKLKLFSHFKISEDHLDFQLSPCHLEREIEFLKEQGIDRVVTLTERHHAKEILQNHFSLHHIAIEDLGAPELAQAHELARILETARENGERLAVHCLAGIGRTSTMLIAAHMLLGENFKTLHALVSRQNPAFVLSRPQSEFLQTLALPK